MLVPWQIVVPGFAEILTDAVTLGFTVIVTVFEVSGLFVAQTAFEVIMQRTTFPFDSDDVLKTVLLVPAFEPLICQI